MLISDKHRLILMLPQKCASTTLQKRLQPIHDLNRYGSGLMFEESMGRFLTKHISLEQARQLEAFNSRSGHLKACFVRNPYDRIYSWFQWIHSSVNKPDRVEKLRSMLEKGTPRDLVEKKIKAHEAKIRQMRAADFDFNKFINLYPKMFQSISDFTHTQGRLLMDFIGRVETFDSDFIKLCDMINYSPTTMENSNVLSNPGMSPNGNPSGSKYLSHYNSRSIAIINEHHAVDFDFFGYEAIQP